MAHTNSHTLGYNKLAKLMGSNTEVAVFRRFGSLNMINLLYMQAELMELERKFEMAYLDDSTSQVAAVEQFHRDFTKLRASKGTQYGHQVDLLMLIKQKLEDYNSALTLASDVVKLKRPNHRDLKLLQKWLEDDKLGGDFLEGTEAFTWNDKNNKDFVVIDAPPPDNEALFSSLSSIPLDLFHRFLRNKQSRVPDIETGLLVYDDKSFRRLNKLITTTIASLLPIVAIIVLYAVQGTWRRIYVTIAFTALFGMAMACTSARKSEIFAATAAFAAVEVVFVGSVSGE